MIKIVKKDVIIQISGEDTKALMDICSLAERSVSGSQLWRDYINEDDRERVLNTIREIKDACLYG